MRVLVVDTYRGGRGGHGKVGSVLWSIWVLVAPRPTRLREIGDTWLSAAAGGGIRNRSGDRYKPSTLRGYEQALREYVYPDLGARSCRMFAPVMFSTWSTRSPDAD